MKNGMKMSKIVVGLGFGDEGKGRTTSYLCSVTYNPIVVRANGGHQAGHTVVHNGVRHIFSTFGSGTLQGVPTYWHKNCTFFPTAVFNEHTILKKFLPKPKLYVHPLCPVTTPFDIIYNKEMEKRMGHGSVGVGFGATLQRQESHYKLFVQDLYYENILREKLRNISMHYCRNGLVIEGRVIEDVADDLIDRFVVMCNDVKEIIEVSDESIIEDYYPIFEGAQGIMLDQDFGFFPNVTRSNTTSKNALELLSGEIAKPFRFIPEIYYVTRAYQTRHGNGYMTNENLCGVQLKNNEHETNKDNEFLGKFRKTVLDIDLLNYALECDNHFSTGITKNLVITCADQTGAFSTAVIGGRISTEFLVKGIPSLLKYKFDKVFISTADNGDLIQIQ